MEMETEIKIEIEVKKKKVYVRLYTANTCWLIHTYIFKIGDKFSLSNIYTDFNIDDAISDFT